eukprot:366325-Chlamydomonas_euryale.AAC.4
MGRHSHQGTAMIGTPRSLGHRNDWDATVIRAPQCLGRHGHWGTAMIGTPQSLGHRNDWDATVIRAPQCLGRNGHWGTATVAAAAEVMLLCLWNGFGCKTTNGRSLTQVEAWIRLKDLRSFSLSE